MECNQPKYFIYMARLDQKAVKIMLHSINKERKRKLMFFVYSKWNSDSNH